MDRRALVARLLDDRGDLFVVTSLGSATYDVAACGDHPLNFYIWSGLGCTPSVGLGLALARPDRRVAVFTGDGDVLMGLGSLATIGVKQPANLSIVCLDNGHYSATGMQPSATSAGIDLAQAAAACRLHTEAVSDLSRADELRTLLHSGRGPIFIHARVDADDQKRIFPSRDGLAIKHRFMQAAGTLA
jgi:thiamine pyrophosphate-dependent acetolactate synthase large subunit-like protein